MTNKEIEQVEKKLNNIATIPDTGPRRTATIELAKELGVNIDYPHRPGTLAPTEDIIGNIYRFLQTKMMLNACVSARSSCKWASIAAAVAAFGIIASWSLFLHKMIFQILKVFLNRF